MASPIAKMGEICYACKETFEGGQKYIKVKTYSFHPDCFKCPICQAEMQSYVWHKGVFLCSPKCRAAANQNEALLPALGTKWVKSDASKGGWAGSTAAGEVKDSATGGYSGATAITNSGKTAISLGNTFDEAKQLLNGGGLRKTTGDEGQE